MATSPITGTPLPNAGSTDQVPADLLTAFTYAEKMFLGYFASTSDRDAKVTSPRDGMSCYCVSPGDFYERIGGSWQRRGRSKYYAPAAWPNQTVAGTDNIVSASLPINPNMGPYMISVFADVGQLFAAGSTGNVDFQLLQDGVVIKQRQIQAIANTFVNSMIGASIPMTGGGSTTLQGKLVIPAGITSTTYVDPRHSGITAQVHPIYV